MPDDSIFDLLGQEIQERHAPTEKQMIMCSTWARKMYRRDLKKNLLKPAAWAALMVVILVVLKADPVPDYVWLACFVVFMGVWQLWKLNWYSRFATVALANKMTEDHGALKARAKAAEAELADPEEHERREVESARRLAARQADDKTCLEKGKRHLDSISDKLSGCENQHKRSEATQRMAAVRSYLAKLLSPHGLERLAWIEKQKIEAETRNWQHHQREASALHRALIELGRDLQRGHILAEVANDVPDPPEEILLHV